MELVWFCHMITRNRAIVLVPHFCFPQVKQMHSVRSLKERGLRVNQAGQDHNLLNRTGQVRSPTAGTWVEMGNGGLNDVN